MNHCVYIIFSETKTDITVVRRIILKIRITRHNAGTSKATKYGKPWKLIHTVDCNDRSSARKLEKQVKSRGIGRWLTDNKIG